MAAAERLVRRLCPVDVEDYRAIRLATLRTEPQFFGASYADEAARPVEAFAKAIATSAIFGAYVDGRIAGVVRLSAGAGLKEGHKGSVYGFFVAPEYRRRGLGQALMAALIDTARASLEQLTLSVVAGNHGAIGLYERLGFQCYGVEPRARKDDGVYSDLVLMALRL